MHPEPEPSVQPETVVRAKLRLFKEVQQTGTNCEAVICVQKKALKDADDLEKELDCESG
jgi:hypothetical protein